jgi:hypothetical protein
MSTHLYFLKKNIGTGGSTGTTSKDVVHTVPSKYELWFKRLKEN